MKITALVLAAAAGAAAAQPTFFAFQENTLYRGQLGDTFDSFTFSENIVSAEFNPAGELVGHSDFFSGAGPQPYTVNDPFGTPTISAIGSPLNNRPPSSLEFIEGRAYGFDSEGDFNEYDPTTLEELNQIAPQQLGVGGNGLGYDAKNDVLYMVDRNNDELYTVNVSTGDITSVGSLGVDVQNAGASFLFNTLWVAYQDNADNIYKLGSVNVLTGEITELQQLADFPSPSVDPFVVSLAVIPAPGGVAVLGLAGLAAARRRR